MASAPPESAQDDESPQPLSTENAQASPSQLIAEQPPKVDPSSPASITEKITPPALVQKEPVSPLAPVAPPMAVRPEAVNPSIKPMAQARPMVSIPRSEPAFSASTWPRERSWRRRRRGFLSVSPSTLRSGPCLPPRRVWKPGAQGGVISGSDPRHAPAMAASAKRRATVDARQSG